MIGYFDEDQNVKSVTRLCFFIMIIVALAICIYQVWLEGKIDIAGFLAMVGTACTLKISQKAIESNNEKKEIK